MGRSHGRRVQLEIMACPMSGPQGLFFPYSKAGGGYSMESFRLEFSGNRVTEQDCRALLMDINGCPMTKATCDKGSLFFLVSFVVMAVCMAVFMVTATRDRGKSNSIGEIFGLGYGVILGGGLITIIVNLCIMLKRVQAKAHARTQVINAIMKKHNDSTFAGKQALARLSTFGGYITIQFLWVAQPMMMTPMMMAPVPMAYSTNQVMGSPAPMMQK